MFNLTWYKPFTIGSVLFYTILLLKPTSLQNNEDWIFFISLNMMTVARKSPVVYLYAISYALPSCGANVAADTNQ
jgi:hypothetical protein